MTELSRLMTKQGLLQSVYEKRMKHFESTIASTFLANSDVVMRRAVAVATVCIALQIKALVELRMHLQGRLSDLHGRHGRKPKKTRALAYRKLEDVTKMIRIKQLQARIWEALRIDLAPADLDRALDALQELKSVLSDDDYSLIQDMRASLPAGKQMKIDEKVGEIHG